MITGGSVKFNHPNQLIIIMLLQILEKGKKWEENEKEKKNRRIGEKERA
jgi:hypothetical protein